MRSLTPLARTTALFIALFAQGPARAAEPCAKAITDAQMLDCEAKNLAAADAQLNVAYAKLMKLLDAEGKKKLRDAQRAWVAFRDANAVFAGDQNRGGSAEALNRVGTQATMTHTRVKELLAEIEARE